MTITYHANLEQGSDEWRAARCGLLTASEMHLIITPATLKVASNDKERGHLYELVAQRITRFVEASYINDDMLRGWTDEVEARNLYAEKYAPVEEVGFFTNDRWGFTLGYSPDGLVGDDGAIECKSRRQKLQVQTLIEHLTAGTIPPEHVIQVQTGLLVSERQWIDYVSYCGGLPMCVIRIWPDLLVRNAIIQCADAFESRINQKIDRYRTIISANKPHATERRIEQDIVL